MFCHCYTLTGSPQHFIITINHPFSPKAGSTTTNNTFTIQNISFYVFAITKSFSKYCVILSLIICDPFCKMIVLEPMNQFVRNINICHLYCTFADSMMFNSPPSPQSIILTIYDYQSCFSSPPTSFFSAASLFLSFFMSNAF